MNTITEFTIIKGKPLDFTIIVKENGTTLSLELDPSDTFTFSIVDKKTQSKIITDHPMVISDAANGEIGGHLDGVDTDKLPVVVSAPEDWFISRPALRLVVSGHTLSQGDMTAIIDDVYVMVG